MGALIAMVDRIERFWRRDLPLPGTSAEAVLDYLLPSLSEAGRPRWPSCPMPADCWPTRSEAR